ncbi:recombinase family protein [Candidatus Peregrinibacteria bacterium]|nr:recombinase family protein [Candidatus Peregrinibacteria bacterium]MBI3817016.1 recombinase family protein [Candidatus Peregrinibacteria bacterium]
MKAVAYYRHSAENKQENSVAIQRELIRAFAQENDITIIHEEIDEGKTGLLADRTGFQQLLHTWVLDECAPLFDYILVRDVDRWARFQNPNEWGYYEFLCNRRGKKVIDVSQGLPRDDRPLATNILTLIKREMAAEYSRQLSEKVFHGCMYVSRQGFSAGGSSCYGMGRLLLNEQRKPLCLLKKGEHKQIANQRVTFIPLEDETTTTVRDVFRLFDEGRTLAAIASMLNTKGIPSASGGKWDARNVLRILQNETYTGKRIYNKTWNRLRQGRRHNPRNEWIICEHAFPALIDEKLFERVQKRLTDEQEETIASSRRRQLTNTFAREFRRHLSAPGLPAKPPGISPFTVSYAIGSSIQKQWCFYASGALRSYNQILCIGMEQREENSHANFFLIPIQAFGLSGVCIVSEGERHDEQYRITQESLAEKVGEIARKTVSPVHLS